MLPRAGSPHLATVTADEHIRHSATLRVPADHPALAGHFPGNPVVPGVVILDAVISAAESWQGASFDVDSISHAKFLAPLKPDVAARIELVLRTSSLEFSVYRDGASIAKGVLIGTTRTAP
jgi:3-hydroxymyristoyl/3-hydroxydecanoyl-(acyl carrier protein) dehydratase